LFDLILKDLQDKFGSKVLLGPEDIADIIDMTVGQQSNKRSDDDFPIPWSKDTGRVKVTIYHLADYLANHGKRQVKQEMSKIPDKLTRIQKKATKGHLEKEWWLFRSPQITAILGKSILEIQLATPNVSPKKLKI
jgi:hypothetical protein